MFKSILVAVDGSAHSMNAVAAAADIAQKFSSQVILLHVLGRGAPSELEIREMDRERLVKSAQSTAPSVADAPVRLNLSRRDPDQAERIRDVRESAGKQLLQQAEELARSKGAERIVQKLLEGSPEKRILEQANHHDVDLIAMGARGLSDIKGLLLGSVSHKVCHLAKCACLTVKA